MAQASSASSRSPPRGGKKKRRFVVFDSSFLIAVMERPTPWIQDITEKLGSFVAVVVSSVRDELKRLADRGVGKGRFAALALELLDRGDLTLEPDGGGRPDDEIISFALREGAAVATIDSDLAARLRASRVFPVVTLRGGRVSI